MQLALPILSYAVRSIAAREAIYQGTAIDFGFRDPGFAQRLEILEVRPSIRSLACQQIIAAREGSAIFPPAEFVFAFVTDTTRLSLTFDNAVNN